MATQFADATVDLDQLTEEIEALNLPGFKGLARFAGNYIEVRSDNLSASQQTAVTNAISSHSPSSETSYATTLASDITGCTTIANIKTLLHKYLR
jgi:hypothetical protein